MLKSENTPLRQVGLGDGLPLACLSIQNLVSVLLGTPTLQCDDVGNLPGASKYIFIGISCQQGPLSEYVAMSGLFAGLQTPSKPPLLSLLRKSPNVWVSNAFNKCAKTPFLAAASLQEASKYDYLDIQPAMNSGCNAFLCLAAALPTSACTSGAVAVVMGFKNWEDCSQSSVTVAKLITRTVIMNYQERITAILEATAMLVSPPPLAAFDAAEDGREMRLQEEWEEMVDTTPPNTSYNMFSLAFRSPAIEAAFVKEYNAKLEKRDAVGYILAFSATLCFIFRPKTNFNQLDLTKSVQLWRWFVCYLPGLLLIRPDTRRLYLKNRESLLTYMFITSALWSIHGKRYTDLLNLEPFARLMYMHSFAWVALLLLSFQIRVRLLVPLTLACFAVDARIFPKICSDYIPDVSSVQCLVLQAGRWGLIALAGPLVLVWLLERKARNRFRSQL